MECPHFERELAALDASQIADVLTAWQTRLKAIRAAGRNGYVFIFKNSGFRAGASLPHSHSQLIAASIIPPTVQRELDVAKAFYQTTGEAILSRVLREERDANRVVVSERGITAFCPFASRFASEVWLAPTDSVPFRNLGNDDLDGLASVLHRILNAILSEHPSAAYNILLHATPFTISEEAWFRWRIEICPRLAQFAGFELGTGWYINAVPPEAAAANLRAVLGSRNTK